MNKAYLCILGMAVAAGSLTSCKDDFNPGSSLPEGTEIQFGSNLSSDGTRTYYDPADEGDFSKSAWKIFWNTPDMGLDKIFISSPEAASGRNQATFTVTPKDDNKYESTSVTRVGDAGIQASNADNYNFYALYPSSAVTGASGSTISATFKGQQDPTFSGTIPTTGTFNISLKSDMQNCLMTATRSMSAADVANGVSLQFLPYASVLDIEINGPETGIYNTGVRISSVIIESNQQISGNFQLDFSKKDSFGNPTFTGLSNSTNDNFIYIDTRVDNGSGVLLRQNCKMTVRAFLLPNTNVNNLKITVLSDKSEPWTKELTMTNFKPSQIHKVKLPKLTTATTVDYSTWLSQLNDDIYLSELSLPGSAFAFNYDKSLAADQKTQVKTFREQLLAGSRVLQAHVSLDNYSQIDNTPYIASTNGIVTYNGQKLSLEEVISAIVQELKAKHGDEFCVLSLSDYTSDNSNRSLESLYSSVSKVLNAHPDEVVTNIDANTTLGDVRNKVIIKIQFNGDGGVTSDDVIGSDVAGGCETTAQMNALLDKINRWTGALRANALMNWWTRKAGSEVFYAPLLFARAGAFRFTEFGDRDTEATLEVLDQGLCVEAAQMLINNARWGLDGTWHGDINLNSSNPNSLANFNNVNHMWLIFAEESNVSDNYDLARLVPNAINNTYNKEAHNKFYMTFLGGTGLTTSTRAITRWQGQLSSLTDKPYGWVLMNLIGGDNATVNNAVKSIIDHNSDMNPAPAMRPATQTPTNDASSKNRGPLFGMRRR